MAAVAALALAVPGSASATVLLGSTFDPEDNCAASATTFVQSSSADNSYTVPSDGVITSWAHQADPVPPSLRFKVLRPLGGNSFALVGESELTPLTASVVNEFPVRIPVKSGDVIGLYRDGALTYNCMTATANAADVIYSALGDVGTTAYPGIYTGYTLDVAAHLEPDADRDGFGDETQDQCPTDASTQGTCPSPPSPTAASRTDTDSPQTTISKRPPNKTKQTTVKFKFRSDEAGSTFECKLDQKPWKRCSSPTKVNRLAEGKHKFEVRAKDAAGNVDPTPAKDTFEVVD